MNLNKNRGDKADYLFRYKKKLNTHSTLILSVITFNFNYLAIIKALMRFYFDNLDSPHSNGECQAMHYLILFHFIIVQLVKNRWASLTLFSPQLCFFKKEQTSI